MFSRRLGAVAVKVHIILKANVLVHDIIMAGASLILAVFLRVGHEAFTEYSALLIKATPLCMAVAGVMFIVFGMYRGVWRYASLSDLAALGKAVTLTILVFMALLFFIDRNEQLPRSVPLIQWFVLTVMVGLPRLSYRLFKSRLSQRSSGHHWLWNRLRQVPDQRTPVLVVGVSNRAALFIRAMEDAPDGMFRVVGLLDEGALHLGRSVHAVPVLGMVEDLLPAVASLASAGQRPQRVIIAEHHEELQGERLRTLIEQAEQLAIPVARLDRFSAFSGARVELSPIALEDLLGRPQVSLDHGAIGSLLAGRRVLVTGAGGSIGSELCEQIARYEPASLIITDACEFNLYTIDLKLQEAWPLLARRAVLLNVRDAERLEQIFLEHRPQLVFHAAALKHVPMVEAHPGEGLLTNTFGTRHVADAVWRHGTEAMVLISTDKAVNPSSMMGATKRLAEFYCQALDFQGRSRPAGRAPRFITVRFGNVLGSSGSVVPLFERQIAQGGPLTITHPDIERYFMTIQEAVELVLQASAHGLAHADERGQIYVLDMGKPIRVADIARQLIRLHGQRPDLDVKLQVVGLRPGEKLFEELFDIEEQQVAVTEGILAALSPPRELCLLKAAFRELGKAARRNDAPALRRLVGQILHSYRSAADPADLPLSAADPEQRPQPGGAPAAAAAWAGRAPALQLGASRPAPAMSITPAA